VSSKNLHPDDPWWELKRHAPALITLAMGLLAMGIGKPGSSLETAGELVTAVGILWLFLMD
jgi:hypothetical protein